MLKIAVVGTTGWGTTLGIILAQKDIEIRLWARTRREADKLRNEGPDPDKFPGVSFPPGLLVTSQLSEAMAGARVVILAVPSQTMRQNVKLLKKHLAKSTIVVSAAKGLEIETNKRMSQVIAEELGGLDFHPAICVLSGPNLSREIQQHHPAATVVAAEDEAVARKVQRLLTTPNFCVFTHTDVVGVELGGALKNIIALGAGIIDGLGYGDNAKAAFVTRGLTEITALGVALGANPLTLSGLAGLGDLIATCASPLSRNHHVGVELAKGRPLDEILESMSGVAEGVGTTLVAHNLARQLGLGMPIIERIYQVLYKQADLRRAARGLMEANTAHELAGRKWKLFSLFRRHKTPVAP
ncbi:MAG: NAD(P)-dependent glycerol-3-phosphate dehydrogenase [Chloroflexi bacterium]|nr:NAD(P)-dependent glycerol-3-phosphate dehydrogenase [Chloroflexota bacterium]